MGADTAIMEGKGQKLEFGRALASPVAKDGRNRRRLVGLPYEKGTEPKSWITTFLAMNFFLVFAVVYHEYSRSQSSLQLSDTVRALQQRTSVLAPGTVAPHLGAVVQPCSGNGLLETDHETEVETCRCYACFTGKECATEDNSCTIDVYQGDPTIFEQFWFKFGDACETRILGWQRMSYYANSKEFFFVQTELVHAIRDLHRVVGNAVTEGRHIVIGVGSTQLFQAALYALSSPASSTPTSVVSLAPYYSSYPAVTDYVKSSMYQWAGDAAEFAKKSENGGTYIELVTSPNNPTGEVRYPVVNRTGFVVHDLAYYWPHYTPITAPADDPIMLFTVSKSTGHAGTRIGWAIVKDLKVAQRMAKFIELNTIGVSKDSQLRVTQILRFVSKAVEKRDIKPSSTHSALVSRDEAEKDSMEVSSLFHFGFSEMLYRWTRLSSIVQSGTSFSIPEFQPAFCTFFGQTNAPTPAFAWIRCNDEDDCEKFLRRHGILTRGGMFFGAEAKFVRLSMLDRRPTFEILMGRLEGIQRANHLAAAA